MSNMIKTIKYNKVPAGEFKWLFLHGFANDDNDRNTIK